MIKAWSHLWMKMTIFAMGQEFPLPVMGAIRAVLPILVDILCCLLAQQIHYLGGKSMGLDLKSIGAMHLMKKWCALVLVGLKLVGAIKLRIRSSSNLRPSSRKLSS